MSNVTLFRDSLFSKYQTKLSEKFHKFKGYAVNTNKTFVDFHQSDFEFIQSCYSLNHGLYQSVGITRNELRTLYAAFKIANRGEPGNLSLIDVKRQILTKVDPDEDSKGFKFFE